MNACLPIPAVGSRQGSNGSGAIQSPVFAAPSHPSTPDRQGHGGPDRIRVTVCRRVRQADPVMAAAIGRYRLSVGGMSAVSASRLSVTA